MNRLEAELVSLSFEEIYKNIESEWVQAATDFFESLEAKTRNLRDSFF